MFKTLRNAWRIPDLRKKIMFTLLILLLYRIGNVIPVPFVDTAAWKSAFEGFEDTILGLYNVMSGSGLSQATVLALGIQPYINSSIIVQLLTVAIPALERLAKDGGEEGKKKIEKITRLTTVALGLLMGWAYYVMLRNQGTSIISESGFVPAMVIILTFTAGSTVVMWLGEQITSHGIGNGISMILFANIIAGLRSTVTNLIGNPTFTWWMALIIAVGLGALTVFIIFVNDAERRIPIQYAKRVVGRKIYGGQSSNLPIKVSMSGVMPVIFAQSICSLPATIATFCRMDENNWWYRNVFASTSVIYIVIYFIMIFFFGWFYASIQYDPVEISNNLKKNGGFIPGFRPGKPTADFIKKVINKIIVFGSVYLAVVALLPLVAAAVIKGFEYLAIGGTSIIIVVGVALETVKALEAQMLMRHYKGFLD